MASKNQDASAARANAKAKAQQQVKAKERRTTVIIIAVSLVVIAAFAGIVYFIVNSANVPPLAEAGGPAIADETGGIAVGSGGVAGVDVPTDAVRVDVYLDLMCPVCNQFEQINGEDLNALREAGTIQMVYHPISILDRYSAGTKYSTRAANALAVVADKSPEQFLGFLDALYANQPAENTTGLDDATIAALAIGAGVPSDVAETFADGEFTKWVAAATQQASADGMQGTPTVMVDREILDQNQVPYFQEGALKSFLEEQASA
ncbi:DsbA family protein [Demequina sp.]|uniref:DsbA family protein n=1 Tax=Demequina sp. TaxID=2050685 RepID=UPI003D0E8644